MAREKDSRHVVTQKVITFHHGSGAMVALRRQRNGDWRSLILSAPGSAESSENRCSDSWLRGVSGVWWTKKPSGR